MFILMKKIPLYVFSLQIGFFFNATLMSHHSMYAALILRAVDV